MTMRNDFELAEVMWDAADPCLSDTQRRETLIALHTGEPYIAILTVVTALARSGHPLPPDVHREFREWLRRLPALDPVTDWPPQQLELHVMAAEVRASPDAAAVHGDYGGATLCYFVLDDAGVADASPERQAEALRGWLTVNRPSPSLRMDMQANGFGYLLDERKPGPPDGPGVL